MRNLILSSLAMLSLTASAQEVTTLELKPTQKKNEIGMLTDLGFSNNNSGIGIQYKHWKNDSKAIRANVSYSEYNYAASKIYFPAQGDTVFSSQAITDISTVSIGLGVEMQRHFYKKIYMYAAIDVYANYGKGNTNEILSRELTQNGNNERLDYDIAQTYSSTIFKAGILPLVGVKFNFNRISFGTELSGMRMEYSSLKHSNGMPSTGGIVDFDMGNFSQRVFVNFRF